MEVVQYGGRSKAAVGCLRDEVPQKLKMFCELASLGWTLVKGLKHLRFILWCADRGYPYHPMSKIFIRFMKISQVTLVRAGWPATPLPVIAFPLILSDPFQGYTIITGSVVTVLPIVLQSPTLRYFEPLTLHFLLMLVSMFIFRQHYVYWSSYNGL